MKFDVVSPRRISGEGKFVAWDCVSTRPLPGAFMLATLTGAPWDKLSTKA